MSSDRKNQEILGVLTPALLSEMKALLLFCSAALILVEVS